MIEPSTITSLLIGGAWIDIKPSTFVLGAFEIGDLASGRHKVDEGFQATAKDGSEISGPMRVIQSVGTGGRQITTKAVGQPNTARKGRPPTAK